MEKKKDAFTRTHCSTLKRPRMLCKDFETINALANVNFHSEMKTGAVREEFKLCSKWMVDPFEYSAESRYPCGVDPEPMS